MSKKTQEETPVDPRLQSYALGHRARVLSASDGAELKRLLVLAGARLVIKPMSDGKQYGEIVKVESFEVVNAK